MRNKKIIMGAVLICIIIGVIMGFMVHNNYRRLHDASALKTNFIGEWINVDDETLKLVVTDEIASFKQKKNNLVAYEDCTYELNSKYHFVLNGVNNKFECQMNSKYNKLVCESDKKITLKKVK